MTKTIVTSTCGRFVIETNGNFTFWTRNLQGRAYRNFAGRSIESAMKFLEVRVMMGY
jgi:hypothetical protein